MPGRTFPEPSDSSKPSKPSKPSDSSKSPAPPPPSPSPEHARLAAALRELKARTGLSLAGLAAKTPFSKSSWERYLNGRTLPPRQAVQELCRLAGEPAGRCLALWEIVESQWSGRATEATRSGTPAPPLSPAASPTPAPTPAPAEVKRAGDKGALVVAVLASVCAVVVTSVTAALLLLPPKDDVPRPSAPSSASESPAATGPDCLAPACEGRNTIQMKCAVAPDTLASHRTATGARMELRHSKECEASWARMWGTRTGDRIELTVVGRDGRAGRPHSATVEDDVDAESYVYTPMATTRSGTVVRACFQPAAGNKAGNKRECFDGRVH
ncbi:helix-turn-helix domain-containing protein [Streptomyces sp. NPDC005474]|uniref:helix-turn-helix domain-containing protein n=1 Tax=Streptomyces sp. NPDC005474 TaxID=3154878 RepID=UPI0034539899